MSEGGSPAETPPASPMETIETDSGDSHEHRSDAPSMPAASHPHAAPDEERMPVSKPANSPAPAHWAAGRRTAGTWEMPQPFPAQPSKLSMAPLPTAPAQPALLHPHVHQLQAIAEQRARDGAKKRVADGGCLSGGPDHGAFYSAAGGGMQHGSAVGLAPGMMGYGCGCGCSCGGQFCFPAAAQAPQPPMALEAPPALLRPLTFLGMNGGQPVFQHLEESEPEHDVYPMPNGGLARRTPHGLLFLPYTLLPCDTDSQPSQ